MRGQIIDIIFDKLLSIDAEIKFDVDKLSSESVNSEQLHNRKLVIDETANKLDILMIVMFQYIQFLFIKQDEKQDISNVFYQFKELFSLNNNESSSNKDNASTVS